MLMSKRAVAAVFAVFAVKAAAAVDSRVGSVPTNSPTSPPIGLISMLFGIAHEKDLKFYRREIYWNDTGARKVNLEGLECFTFFPSLRVKAEALKMAAVFKCSISVLLRFWCRFGFLL